MPHFWSRQLFEAPGLTLRRVECDGCDEPRARAEEVTAPVAVVLLRGGFRPRGPKGALDLHATSLWLAAPGDEHVVSHPRGEGDACLSIDGAIARRLLSERPAASELSPGAFVAVHRLQAALGAGQPLDALEVEERLCSALTPEVSSSAYANMRISARDRRVTAAIAAELERRFDEPLRLDELASIAGVSPFAACRSFARAAKTSIHARLTELRLRHGLALLLDTRRSIAAIALDAGFSSHAHFTARFSRRFGRSPRQLRQR